MIRHKAVQGLFIAQRKFEFCHILFQFLADPGGCAAVGKDQNIVDKAEISEILSGAVFAIQIFKVAVGKET